MSSNGGVRNNLQLRSQWVLGVIVPLVMIAIILTADVIEGPKTAYVGVLSAVPLFSAIFGTPRSTVFVAIVTWLSAYTFGHVASDGNVRAQTVRLVIIAIFGVIAVVAAVLRVRRDRQLAEALTRAAQADVIEMKANSDQLTGLLNRRGVLASVIEPRSTEMTMALFDVDGLKGINDKFGHLVGDEFICGVSARIAGGVSKDDIVGRWGGDEFVVILDLPVEQGTVVIERVFGKITTEPLSTSAASIPVGISIGVARWSAEDSIDTVLAMADEALYSAKRRGRNMVAVSP